MKQPKAKPPKPNMNYTDSAGKTHGPFKLGPPPHPQLAGLKAALDIVETRKKQLDEKLSMSFESNELGRIAAMLKYEILVLTKTGEPLKSANVRKAGATRHVKT